VIGALVAGRLADVIGRRDVIMVTAALFTLGAFAIAPSELVLLSGRLVVGLGADAEREFSEITVERVRENASGCLAVTSRGRY